MFVMYLYGISEVLFSHSKYIQIKKTEYYLSDNYTISLLKTILTLPGNYSYFNFIFKETDSFSFFINRF